MEDFREGKGLVLSSFIQSLIEAGMIPGAAVEVCKDDEIVFSETFGCIDPSKEHRVSQDTLYRIFSNTKPITAVAVLILVDRGRLHLDDDVSRWIPEFRNMKVFVSEIDGVVELEDSSVPITVRNLLSHTSGITYGIFGNHYCDRYLMQLLPPENRESWFRNCTLESLCEAISKTPLLFQPGTKWNYGLNFEILSRIIEIVTGMRFYDFLLTEIFQPLEMTDTCFVVPPERMQRVMPCYELSAGASFTASASSKYDVQSGDCLQGGGAGLVSSMHDLSRFARCLCADTFYSSGKRLLSEEATKLISTNCLLNSSNMPATLLEMSFNTGFSESIGDGIGFGLGVYVLINPSKAKGGSLSSIGEFGWGGVASTWMMIDPDQKLTLTFMTQLVPSSSYPIRSQLRWLCHFITQHG